ncbi:MAG TPA: hypothetical protein VHE30_21985 [Polyangiaceae bacterium]|nr:hypothetical protein [Polyangiaceae bacterium]
MPAARSLRARLLGDPAAVIATGVGALWLAALLRAFWGYELETPRGRFWGVADDVYISADFARTFLQGGGLRWFPEAPKVEGFSNPLWVAVLAVVHALPGFRETDLGLWLVAVNAAVLVALAHAYGRGLRRALSLLSVENPTAGRVALSVLVSASGCVVLCHCAAIGFETALATWFAFAAFVDALAVDGPVPVGRVGVLVGLAFWTRMDAVLPCAAAVVLVFLRGGGARGVARALSIASVMMAASFVARFLYFGQWLPNTYYLKATGWPLRPRLEQGMFLALAPVLLLALAVVPGLVLVLRRSRAVGRLAAIALLPYGLTLFYSVHNGGDLVAAFGLDRFTAMGTPFLVFGLSIVALALPAGRVSAFVGSAVAMVVAAGPALDGLRTFLDPRGGAPRDTLVEAFAYQGELIRDFARSGARVAVCAAGATVYFSHAGGVDLLGKIEPLVAREPVRERVPPDARCWRGFPGAGHNKEDTPLVFAERHPEISVVVPPGRALGDYERFTYRGVPFYARRGTSFVDWSRVSRARK